MGLVLQCLLFFLVLHTPAFCDSASAPLMQKLGAYVMQAAETSPVNVDGRILLVQVASHGLYLSQPQP